MSVVHQIVPWMVRSQAKADHHKPAPLPSLKGAGRPNQQLRLRRRSYPTPLHRNNDRPSSRRSWRERRAISSEDVSGPDGK
eukprot:3156329-Pyramimonas_sp.AAC.1